jgi:uncharacterized protein (DUF58 family)
MNSSPLSLLENISRYAVDSRIGKSVLSVKGTGVRMGERVSAKPGYSPVIMDYRLYGKGDPVKDIDWKLSARTEKLFVKIREGYRQTDFVIIPDGSGSMRETYESGTSKFVTGLTLAYIAGSVALKSGDRVHVSYAGEKIRADSVYSLIEILTGIESSGVSNGFWKNVTETSTNVFLISDFLTGVEEFTGLLKGLYHNTKNLFMISIHDPFEENLDLTGRFRFLDTESSGSVLLDAGKSGDVYRHLYREHYRNVAKAARSFGAKAGRVSTDEDPYHAFVRVVS